MFHRSSSAPSGPGSSNDDHHIYANVGDPHGPTSVTAVSSQYGGYCLLIAVVNLSLKPATPLFILFIYLSTCFLSVSLVGT